jgi:hypothetical protein
MALLSRYNPPAYLSDFNVIPGQLDAWHDAVSAWFDAVIAVERKHIGTAPQYFNAATFDPGGTAVEQAVTWNAFPKELLRRYGRARALELADLLWPIEHFGAGLPDPADPVGTSGVLYRPQEEYCEWHVLRDPDTQKIERITFTSEPPEYWQALAGFVAGDPKVPIPSVHFPGSHQVLLDLYHQLVSPEVKLEDLIPSADVKNAKGKVVAQKGKYNIYNPWNSTRGIAHLHSPPNSLVAEILLGGDGTVLRTDSAGRLLVEPDALICAAGYGGPNRNSDPTIGASVNALARLGAYVTLRNPVGLYMDHVDLSGWEAPDGGDIQDFVQIVRGTPGMIERLVIAAPVGRKVNVGDLTIAGEPIRYGGQVAECITVKLVGVAHLLPSPEKRPAIIGTGRGYLDPAYPTAVGSGSRSLGLPAGTVEAYQREGVTRAPSAALRRERRRDLDRGVPMPIGHRAMQLTK